MIFIILLLISLTSCVCGTFVVNVTQTSYQAEEGDDITLEWRFTTKPDISSNSLFILCELLTDLKPSVLFHLHEGVEVSESLDEQFAGRIHCDKDVLREGRIRLHVSRLRTDDSGLYLCEVRTDDGSGSAKCRLNVTAAADEPKPQRPTVRPEPESREIIGLHVGLGLTAALLAVCAGLFFGFRLHLIKCVHRNRNVSSASYTAIAKRSGAASQLGQDDAGQQSSLDDAVGEDSVQVEGDEGGKDDAVSGEDDFGEGEVRGGKTVNSENELCVAQVEETGEFCETQVGAGEVSDAACEQVKVAETAEEEAAWKTTEREESAADRQQ